MRHRAPEADFARGAARFSYDLKAVNEAAAAAAGSGGGGGGGGEEGEGEGGGDMTAADRLFPTDLEGDRVWLDLQRAVAATRPNVNVGGKMNPEPTYDEDLAEREPLPYRDALYDVEKGLAFLRNGHYTAAADFASALNPRGDDDLENRSPEFGPGGRNPAAPDFYDVGTEAALAAMAYPRGGGRQIIPIPHDACFC